MKRGDLIAFYWILGLGLAVVLGLGAMSLSSSHGHIAELLEVRVRVVDRDTGQPLADAVVATVRAEDWVDRIDFKAQLTESLDLQDERRERPRYNRFVCGARVDANGAVILASCVYVTRYWRGSIQTGKELLVPDLLLIEHPRHGRTIRTIDEGDLAAGAAPNTWRLDLGTIRIP